MILWEILRVAVGSLRAHRLRTILTLLGVILGVMTVVAVVSVISGLNAYVANTLAVLTPDVFIVSKFGIITSRADFIKARRRKDLTIEEMQILDRDCRSCAMVGGEMAAQKAVTYLDRRLGDVEIDGETANTMRIFQLNLDAGRFFNDSEYEHAADVAVIGYDVRDELFPRLDPIGRTLKIDGRPFKVIGLLARRGSFLGQSQDKEVDVPMTAYRKAFGTRRSVDIFVRAVSPAAVPLAQDEVRSILRARRHSAWGADDPFGFVTGEALNSLYKQITFALFAVMVLISGISLVVGGIVIANIMLVAVTERTREIGVRMALGARKRYVLGQFLLEAALMAAFGGAIGVLFGAGIARTAAWVSPLPTRVTPFLVFVSLGMATCVGLVAGIAPSIRAANLPPVEALRSE